MARFHNARLNMIAGLGLGLAGSVTMLLAIDAPWKGAAAKALKKGKAFGVEEYTQTGLWWSALGMAILLALLLATIRWWWKWTERRPLAEPHVGKSSPGRWEIIGLISALVLAAVFRFPMADQGILWDEHDNLRRNFHGFTAMDAKADAEPWQPAGYREAFFENSRSNNPFLYSILAHASLDVWHLATGAPRDRFNVVAMRVPALIAGLLGIFAIWHLGRKLGGPWVGIVAAILCALHPLHIRYSVEARGYSLVLVLAPVFLSCCMEVVRRGSWKMAFGVAFSAAALLYSFPGGLYFIGMGAVGLFLMLCCATPEIQGWVTLRRLIIAGTLSLAVLVLLLTPALMQALKTLDAQFQKGGLPAPWHFQTWHWMTLGVHVPGEIEYFELRDGKVAWLPFLKGYIVGEPITALAALVLIPVLLWLGGRALWKSGPPARVVVIASVVAPVVCLLHHGLLTKYQIFQWYMIYSLPLLVLIASVGICILVGGNQRLASWPARLGVLSLIGVFVLASYPRIHSRLGGYATWNIDNGLPTARTQMQRGTNLWETWQDGKVLRLGKVAKDASEPSAN